MLRAANLTHITLPTFTDGFGQSATDMSRMFDSFAQNASKLQIINIYWLKTDMGNFDSRTNASKDFMFSGFATGSSVGETGAWMHTASQSSTDVFKTGTQWQANSPNFTSTDN